MSKPTKYYSTIQEKAVADALGGYTVGGSGAMPTSPGDAKTYDWLVECKTHTSPDHAIFFDAIVWKKINDEAMATHRKPVLIVDDGSQDLKKTWCLCNAKNLNLASVVCTDYPVTIRKNISCKHDKLKESLKEQTKGTIGGNYFTEAVFEVEWEGETVCIMPFETFKELFER